MENEGGVNQNQGGAGNPLLSNNSTDINQLREAIQNDPNLLQNIMSSLAQVNPQLYQVYFIFCYKNIQ